jgi:hypothetical protein
MSKPVKCYRNTCSQPATHQIRWGAFPAGPYKTDPVCRKHAIQVQERCPQVGQIAVRVER